MTTEDPDSALPVVVVGAGIIGLSAAWHLAGLGERVVLVDEGPAAGATTTAGAGFVGLWAAGYAWYWNESERDVEQYGIDFYRGVADRAATTGADTGYRQNGNVWLTVTDEGLRDHVPPFEDHPLRPDGARTLTPEDAAELVPGLDPAAVTGGFFHPQGIQISAPETAAAIVAEVRARGVDVREHTRVDALEHEDGRVTGVRTGGGVIAASRVVLATGSWTNTLLAPFGRTLPTVRVVASRLVTAPFGLPSTLPTLMLPELNGLWIREHRGGLTYGAGIGYRALHVNREDAEHRPVRPDLLRAMTDQLRPRVERLLPGSRAALAAPLTSTQGIVSMTADRRFIVGPLPEIDGVVVAAGDNESGVTHGPGLGRIAAELAVTGRSTLGDATRYAPARFDAAAFADDPFVAEAAVQAAMPARREADARRAGATA